MTKSFYDAWREYFLRLDDENFLTLMRVYLGNFKTPYNKQRLIESLESFLRRAETQKNILDLLSYQDIQILCAVNFIPEASLSKLSDFFKEDFFCDMLPDCIKELKSRLLIFDYENPTTYINCLKINPLLENPLKPFLRTEYLVPDFSGKLKKEPSSYDCFSSHLLGAYLSYLAKNKDICKLDGTFKKRAEADISEKFPGQIEKIKLLTKALDNLGIIQDKDGVFKINWDKVSSVANLDEASLAAYILVSVSMRYSKRRTNFYAEIFLNTLEAMPESGWARQTFLRYAYLLAARPKEEEGFSGGAQSRFARILQAHRQNDKNLLAEEDGNTFRAFFDRMLDHAETLGILRPAIADTKEDLKILFANRKLFKDCGQTNSINIDSAFSVMIMPGISFGRISELVKFMNLVKYDTAAQFEITQSSVIRAFDEGLTARQIISILKDNSDFSLPESLVVSLNEWERAYKSVSIFKGFVMKFDKEAAERCLQNPVLKKHIFTRLAPDIVLLDCPDENEVQKLLKECGMDNTGKIQTTQTSLFCQDLPPLASRKSPLPTYEKKHEETATAIQPDREEKYIQNLYKDIEGLNLDSYQKDLLRNLAAAKILVNASQLCKINLPMEKNSAAGMDYDGKLYVIEQAIKDDEQLIFRLSKKSKLLKGSPVGIDRTSFEDGVYLNIIVDGTQNEYSIGKIEFVQRVRKLNILR